VGRGSAALIRVLQFENEIGDAGAAGLGEGLKVNSSLQKFSLVRLFVLLFVFCGGGAGRGGGVGRIFISFFTFILYLKRATFVFVDFFDPLLQHHQNCGPFGFSASSSLVRGCRNLIVLSFDCSEWEACVASDSWVGLPVPPPEVIARGTRSVFAFVRAVLQGGSFASRSCRVMVVGPQMVRAHARIGRCVLTAAAGWQDQPNQRAERRPVSAHRPRTSNSVGASQPTAVGGWGGPAHMGLCRCSARCRACAVAQMF